MVELNFFLHTIALQAKLNEEKSARQKADLHSQDKERQMSMLSVDYRQIQQRLQKLEGEHRQEVEKVKALQANLDQEQQKKISLATELGLTQSEVAGLKAREAQLTGEVALLRQNKKSVEEELHKVKAQRSMDHLQMKELQDQFEAEQHFSVSLFPLKLKGCNLKIYTFPNKEENFPDTVQNASSRNQGRIRREAKKRSRTRGGKRFLNSSTSIGFGKGR